MDFLANLSWREILAAAVVLLVIYILFTYLRLSRLGDEARLAQELSADVIRKSVPPPVKSAPSVKSPSVKSSSPSRVVVRTSNSIAETPAAPAEAASQTNSEERAMPGKRPSFAWNEPPSENPERYRIEALEQDLARLRREIGGLRAEVQTLREEQQEMSRAHEAPNISPFYSDAMQLAAQGREAEDISAMCGISRAEAELVVALARNNA